MEGKYLITTDDWFVAPDGVSYRAVWGDVEIVEDAFLGIKTNRNSTNWFAKVGDEENYVIVAGCQIHYAVKCEHQPHTGNARSWDATAADGIKVFDKPTAIYLATKIN